MKNSKNLKIFFKIILIIIGAVFLFFVNAFFGNPVSKFLAKRSADEYINEHYASLDLKKDKIFYNFKDGRYTLRLEDVNSMDSKFYLNFDSFGNLKYDSYDKRIFNTYMRFFNALSDYGEKLQKENKFSYEIVLTPREEDIYEKYIKIDEEVDLANFPFPVEAEAFGYMDNPKDDDAMKILQDLQKIMDGTSLDVKSYSILLIPEKNRSAGDEEDSWTDALSIFHIPENVIRNSDLNMLREIKNKQDRFGKD